MAAICYKRRFLTKHRAASVVMIGQALDDRAGDGQGRSPVLRVYAFG
jgi:hypothetical protein